MLGAYNLSLIGLSHLKNENKVCQDANMVLSLKNGWKLGIIADGVGSAAHSEDGANLAVTTVAEDFSEKCPTEWNVDQIHSVLKKSYLHALELIEKRSVEEGNHIKEYETTLTTIVYDGRNVAFAHVGDGGVIVLKDDGKFEIITTAQKGEAFNEVVPLRAGEDVWEFGSIDGNVCAVLMMTDGIFDVACPPLLSTTDNPIWINYVRQFMDRNVLTPSNNEADFSNIFNELKTFFENDKDITDDKTIVGIINTDILPEVRDKEYYKEPNWAQLREERAKKLYEKHEHQAVTPFPKIEKRRPIQTPMPAEQPKSSLERLCDVIGLDSKRFKLSCLSLKNHISSYLDDAVILEDNSKKE